LHSSLQNLWGLTVPHTRHWYGYWNFSKITWYWVGSSSSRSIWKTRCLDMPTLLAISDIVRDKLAERSSLTRFRVFVAFEELRIWFRIPLSLRRCDCDNSERLRSWHTIFKISHIVFLHIPLISIRYK
jgi:hypothetical protein